MSDKLVVEIDSKDAEVAMRNLDRLTTAAEQMGKAFENTKGATSALRELRLMLTGIKGQGSSLDELKNSIQSLNSTADSLKKSFAGSVGQLGRIFKNEMAELKSIVQETGLGVGRAAADSLSDGITSPESRRKIAGAMRAQVAEMQAAYEQELAKGVKFSGRDLFDFKSWGLNIGADAKQAIRDGLVKDAAPIPVERILGLDKSQVVKSAKDSAAVFQEAYSVEMAQGRLLFKNFEQALGLDKSQVVKSAKDSAAIFQEAYSAEMRSMQRSAMPIAKVSRIDAADATYASAMAQMKDYYKELELSTNSGVASTGKMSKAFKQLTIDGNDAHSMARGLASGFNLLWLTWGNLAPLFAGASISFGLKKTFDIGSEVEYQIKMMETLGQTTQAQGRVIRQALREIDQSTQFSLVELSQAMVRLGQSGKTPAEALQILRPAADLASVGMVDLKTSTDLLIQTQALFGKSTADVGKIAAQVFEITKSGVLNVEDIGDSMKYASEANTRFGKSVEETLTILGALAQAGIKGSSAGTAYINFLRDLNGRSGPATAALKELEKATGKTIQVFKETGEQRSAIEIFTDIAAAADNLKAKDADKLLAKIFSDRGGRTFFAMVRDGTIDLTKMVDKLKDVDPNSLFMAAKGLMDTTKGALNILQGAMVGALDQVFEANETQFKTFITDITAVISSPEFAMAIHGMVGAVSGLYESIKTLMPVLTTLGAAWAVFKAASIGVSIFQGLAVAIAGMAPVLGMTHTAMARNTAALVVSTEAWSANGVAMIGNVAASRAAAAGMDSVGAAAARSAATASVAGVGMRGLSVVLGFLSNPIVGIIATLGLLGAAFWSAKSDAEGATAGIAAAVMSNGKINIGQWNEEIRKLRERNTLMGQSDVYTPLESGINEARTKLAKESAEYMTILEKYENESKGASARQQEVLDARYGRVLESKMKSIRKEQEAINQARNAIDSARMKDLSAREEAERQQRVKQQAGNKVQGDIEIPGGGGGGRAKFVEQIRVANDNELKEIEKRNAAELSMMQNQAANAQKILDARHQAGLISEGEYQAQAFAQVKQSEADQLAMLNASKAEYMNGLVARATVLGDALQKAMKLGDDTQIEKFTTELQNLGQTAETFYTGVDNSIAKIADNGMARLGVASIKAQAAIEKLADTEREYWKKDKDEINKLRSLDEMEAKYKNINESVFSLDAANKAAAMTGAAEAEKFSAKLAEMDYAYEVAEQAALAFMTANITALASGDTEAQRLYKGLRDVADALKAAREAAGIKAEASIRDRSLIAFEKARQAQIDAFSNGLADAVETSIFEGGKAGGQKFIEVIRNELLRKPLVAMIRGVMGNVVGSIFGSAGGALGLAGTASAATAAASGGSILGSAGGILSGVGALAGNFGAGLTTGFSGLMAGNLGSTLGLGTGLIGSGATAGGIGTIVGALAPIALGIGALVAISKATKGETRTGGQFGVAFDGSVTNQRRGQTYVVEGQQFDRDFTNGMRTALKDGIAYRLEGDPVAQEQAIRNAVSGTAASINNILKSLGSAAVLTGFSAGLETSSKGRGGVFAGGTLSGGLQFGESGKGDNYDGTLYEKFSTNSPDFKTALENFTLDLKQSTVQALQTVSDIPKTVQTMLAGVDAESLTEEAANQLLEAINSQVVGVNTLRAAISPMGGIFSSIAAASFDAQSRLISLSGGVDQFLQNAGQFVSQYYSETEQAGVAAVRLATVLEGVGIDLTALGVDTKGEFRALVESMDVNTDAGQEQVAALLQVAPQFAELADFLQKNNMTLEQLADSAPQVSALEKLLSPQEQTAASTAESAELLGNLVGETSRVSSAISGLAASIESSTVNIVVQNQASSNVTVPRFAAGGAHQGGMRLVGENGPEFEFTGPSAIYSTSNSTDMLAAAVERGFIAGAAKSTLSVKSMAPMAAGPKTAEDIFLNNFKDWYPEFADRLNKDTIKQLMNFDLLKFSASGSSVTPELLDTVLKLFEEGFSSDKVNQYVELIRGPNPEGQVTNPNLYLEQFKLRTQWGWTPEQIKAEVQGLATTALDSTLKSLYAGVVSRKDLDQVRQVVGESSNAAGITQENLAKLFDAGLLRDYISKDAAGQYSLRASEMFSQGGADGAANAEQQRMNDLLAERRQLEIQLLQAQGQEQEALNRIRANAIEGMSAEAVAAWDFNRALEKQIEQAQQVADLKQEHRNLQLELLKAQGRGEEALALIREEAIKGMTAEAVALYDLNQAVREQIDILNERKGLERRLLEAQGDTAAIRQLELTATHEANRAILLRIWALEDEKKAAEAAQTAVDAAFDALKRAVQSAQEAAEKALKDAYEATEKTLKEQISAAEKIKSAASESLSSLEGIFDLLKEQIKDLRNEAGAAAPVSEGNAYLDRLIASGAKPKQDELADAIESVRAGQKAERYGTAFEYNRDNLVLAGRLDVLQSKVGLEKTIAEQQLKAAEDSLVTLNEQLETAKTQYEEQLAKTKEYYEKVLENAQTQIDVLRGVDKSVLSVTAAVTALNTAVAYAAAQVTAAVLSTNADTTAAKVESVNFRARGGYTPAGLTVVGEEGPELVNFAQPSMVYTSAQTRNLLGWGDSEGVIAELRSLREDNRAQAQALVRMQARLVALMERWDGDGMPEERATA